MELEIIDPHGLDVAGVIIPPTYPDGFEVGVGYDPELTCYFLVQDNGDPFADPDIIAMTPQMILRLIQILTDSELVTITEGKLNAN